MTRKDYVLIAAAFKQELEDRPVDEAGIYEPIALAAMRATAGRLARMLESDNPRFDRERFLKACGF